MPVAEELLGGGDLDQPTRELMEAWLREQEEEENEDEGFSRRRVKARCPMDGADSGDVPGRKAQVLALRLFVGMKPLHEAGIAVDAGMGAAGVAVQRVVAQSATVENRLADGLADHGLP